MLCAFLNAPLFEMLFELKRMQGESCLCTCLLFRFCLTMPAFGCLSSLPSLSLPRITFFSPYFDLKSVFQSLVAYFTRIPCWQVNTVVRYNYTQVCLTSKIIQLSVVEWQC